MAQPSDRAPGVRLITDYGAYEWAMRVKASQEAKKAAEEAKKS